MSRRRTRSEAEPPGSEASLEIAARFLGTRPRSRWEVERRLRRAHASDEVIEATLEHLATLGLVDDLAFSRWWLEQRDRHAPRGKRMVEAELRQHGVGREAIELMRDELAALEMDALGSEDGAGDLPVTEEARARIALAQHLRGRPLPEDPKALQRLGMFLMCRGFGPDTARTALRERMVEETDRH
ncbi:MAG: regulatory protein RecX [Gammaproteobacteria bacterium]|nr:MAG: regulatory protein RecX [Gammaproteobacteria bacterium]